MTDINIGAITEALNDKTDRDLHNVDTGVGADAVVEYQAPTSTNNYTWYKKYKSGWCEMGGVDSFSATAARTKTIDLPVSLSSTNYFVMLQCYGSQGVPGIRVSAQTVSSFTYVQGSAEANYSGTKVFWEVKGIAA